MLEHDMDLGGGQLVYQKEKFFLHSKEVGKNGGKKKKKKRQHAAEVARLTR